MPGPPADRSNPRPANAPATPASAPSRFSVRPGVVVAAAAAAAALTIGAGVWLRATEFFWQSPIANARFQRVTDFDGIEQAAAVSRDGRFVAFLVGSRRTDGRLGDAGRLGGVPQPDPRQCAGARESVGPHARASRRTARSSRSGSSDRTARAAGRSASGRCSTFGGQPRPLFEGVAESDFSPDGARLVYHTPGPGDPMFVTDAGRTSEGRRIFTAPAGLHAHFPLLVARRAIHLLRPGVAARQAGHLAHPRRRRRRRSRSRRTTGASSIRCCSTRGRSSTSPAIPTARGRGCTAWTSSGAFHTG